MTPFLKEKESDVKYDMIDLIILNF